MLYIVPTPIGNMEDITLRAVSVLKKADYVFAEDTRQTKKLLMHLGLQTPLIRYNENDPRSVDKCLQILASGRSAALVSDGGTPCISDPGWKLAAAAAEKNIEITALPGASAVTCAVSGAGFGGGGFVFLGFLPRKPGKIAKALKDAYALEKPVVVYESPHRIVKLLGLIADTLGPQTRVSAAREMSKVFEEWLRGTAGEVKENLEKRKKILGEFALVIAPRAGARQEDGEDEE